MMLDVSHDHWCRDCTKRSQLRTIGIAISLLRSGNIDIRGEEALHSVKMDLGQHVVQA
jgi:hypothetical protein